MCILKVKITDTFVEVEVMILGPLDSLDSRYTVLTGSTIVTRCKRDPGVVLFRYSSSLDSLREASVFGCYA